MAVLSHVELFPVAFVKTTNQARLGGGVSLRVDTPALFNPDAPLYIFVE